MELHRYEPIDHGECSFRLIRLFRGEEGPIRCELFHARLDDTEGVIDYEALSYAWGETQKPYNIEVSGRTLPVTKNLYLALHQLRRYHRDRILWIDAVCIDQENLGERGHQVRQMSSIYEKAVQVVIWLGQSTPETRAVFHYMRELERQVLGHPSSIWGGSSEHWRLLWSNVQLLVGDTYEHPDHLLLKGFQDLLSRPWFRRAWIIQEVANARAAQVMCGAQSISTHFFAIAPGIFTLATFLETRVHSHSQSILDLMPGFSRKSYWWAGRRDLRSLLLAFRGSEASDPRDVIYALLGISSDGRSANIPTPDYEKSLQEVIFDTVAYFLPIRDSTIPKFDLPWQTLDQFLDDLPWLESEMLKWTIIEGRMDIAKLLLSADQITVNTKDRQDTTLLHWAILEGQEEMVKLLLDADGIDSNLRGQNGLLLLMLVGEVNEAIFQLLLNTDKLDISLEDRARLVLDKGTARERRAVLRKLILDAGKSVKT
jgi:hypothetical protein